MNRKTNEGRSLARCNNPLIENNPDVSVHIARTLNFNVTRERKGKVFVSALKPPD
jgi:hypothetical protein